MNRTSKMTKSLHMIQKLRAPNASPTFICMILFSFVGKILLALRRYEYE